LKASLLLRRAKSIVEEKINDFSVRFIFSYVTGTHHPSPNPCAAQSKTSIDSSLKFCGFILRDTPPTLEKQFTTHRNCVAGCWLLFGITTAQKAFLSLLVLLSIGIQLPIHCNSLK
jgi:hypothetical protein